MSPGLKTAQINALPQVSHSNRASQLEQAEFKGDAVRPGASVVEPHGMAPVRQRLGPNLAILTSL